MSRPEDCAAQIVYEIIDHLGTKLGTEWNQLDFDAQIQLRERWTKIAVDHLTKCKVK